MFLHYFMKLEEIEVHTYNIMMFLGPQLVKLRFLIESLQSTYIERKSLKKKKWIKVQA